MTARCAVVRPGTSRGGVTGLEYFAGVSSATAGSRGLCLQLVTIAPGAHRPHGVCVSGCENLPEWRFGPASFVVGDRTNAIIEFGTG